MTNFLHWRKMTWIVFAATAVTVLWILRGGVLLGALAGVPVLLALIAIWFSSRPLWRQGHGPRLRRMRSVHVAFKPADVLLKHSD